MAMGPRARTQILATTGRDAHELSADFTEFMSAERPALVNYLTRHTATREDAEDVAQESFARLLKYENTEPGLWKPLLFRIAHNVLIDQSRRARTHRVTQHEELDEAANDIPSTEALPDECAQQAEELAALRELILALPPRCREVFLLNRIEGMTFVEIAQHLGISSRAVEKSVARALKLLRQGMGSRGPEAF